METKMMYRVWYGPKQEKQALFTDKADAARFAEVMGEGPYTSSYMDKLTWEVQIFD